jgi:hypothetical protein
MLCSSDFQGSLRGYVAIICLWLVYLRKIREVNSKGSSSLQHDGRHNLFPVVDDQGEMTFIWIEDGLAPRKPLGYRPSLGNGNIFILLSVPEIERGKGNDFELEAQGRPSPNRVS